jgi:predicted CopG family antitoxin
MTLTHKTIIIRIDDYEKLNQMRNTKSGRVSFTEIIHNILINLEIKD